MLELGRDVKKAKSMGACVGELENSQPYIRSLTW